ncbi:MAG: class II glutamine amidotransferase [Nevskiaceae bacterium]|nr:MAG: class II glutamine amidotransferase [Nevskiaceae bacterium]TBR73586.1 MAG: class II glutamine amidotransferase [Nevskiaceae bacterium]
MCELLGMSANTPTDLCFSFTGLTQRGGRTGPHIDGWGVVFYDGRGVRVFRDPLPSATSPVARLVQDYPIKSEVAVCHIRQANVGNVCLVNTHPFVRELWGRYWVFAHNGQVPDSVFKPGGFQPVGTTDSEALFCDLLNRARATLTPESTALDWARFLAPIAADHARKGVFNCLLSNGEWLFSHCSTKLASITRRAPFGAAHLRDAEVSIRFDAVTTPHDVVTIIATEPLTRDECWDCYAPGEWRMWQRGVVVTAGGQ